MQYGVNDISCYSVDVTKMLIMQTSYLFFNIKVT